MMMTAEEIRLKRFEKAMRGYRTEEVEAFVAQLASTVEQLSNEKAETEKKLFLMAEKVEEYRAQEETVKATLINAQRLGDNVIREANQKADRLLREAAVKAQRMLDTAADREREEQENLKRLEAEVAGFKGNILSLYQQHIESLTELDRQLQQVDAAVFGAPEAPEEAPEAAELPEEEAAEPAIDHAVSIVDSYEAASFPESAE